MDKQQVKSVLLASELPYWVVGQDNRTPPVGTFYDGFGEPLLIRYREFHMVQRPQSPGCDYPRTYMDPPGVARTFLLISME